MTANPSSLPELKIASEVQTRFAFLVMTISVVAIMLTAAVFIIWPQLDIAISKLLFHENGFVIAQSGFWQGLRRLILGANWVFYGAIIILCFIAWNRRDFVWRLHPREWSYLVAASLVGPAILTNLILKNLVARPRPRDITEFGGGQEFIAVFQTGGTCTANCSFVSGEVSAMAMIFASLMFIGKPWRSPYIAALVLGSLLSFWLRVGMGGHFFSDAIFALLFMVFIAAALYWLILLRPLNPSQKPKNKNHNHG